MIKKKLLEEELYEPVKALFESSGYSVKSEVNNCDVTATIESTVTIIEMKLSLNIELLTQAVKRQKIADAVYIAIPKPGKIAFTKKWKDILHLLRRLELGLIIVNISDNARVAEVVIDPAPFNKKQSKALNNKKRRSLLREIKGRTLDGNKGGSRGKKLLTAYREASLQIACCLEKHGDLTPSQLKKKGTNPIKTQSILTKNYYGWFDKIERGIYRLSDSGKKGLEEYKELSDFYRKMYDTN